MREIIRAACGDRRLWLVPDTGAAPLAVLLSGEVTDEEIREIHGAVKGERPFHLCGFSPVNWDQDYPPWPLETPGRVFGCGAGELTGFLTGELLPAARQLCEVTESVIVGYSLGGLAAMYAACRENSPFAGCGSCSGSLWYPGFTEWLINQPVPGRIYLSLGGKEKNTRDPLMASVQDKTEETLRIVRAGAKAVFVQEHGGHFTDVPGRIARAVRWLLEP